MKGTNSYRNSMGCLNCFDNLQGGYTICCCIFSGDYICIYIYICMNLWSKDVNLNILLIATLLSTKMDVHARFIPILLCAHKVVCSCGVQFRCDVPSQDQVICIGLVCICQRYTSWKPAMTYRFRQHQTSLGMKWNQQTFPDSMRWGHLPMSPAVLLSDNVGQQGLNSPGTLWGHRTKYWLRQDLREIGSPQLWPFTSYKYL